MVGLDPASGEAGAEQALCVVGTSFYTNELYVIESEGMRMSPLRWLEHALRRAKHHSAPIVAE